MYMWRFTRLTNGLSKKLGIVALSTLWYSFVPVHQTLRMSPAMAAGIAQHLSSMGDVAKLCELQALAKRGSYKPARPPQLPRRGNRGPKLRLLGERTDQCRPA